MVATQKFSITLVEHIVHAHAYAIFVVEIQSSIHISRYKTFCRSAFVYAQTCCHIKVAACLLAHITRCHAHVVAACAEIIAVIGVQTQFKWAHLIQRTVVAVVVAIVVEHFCACRPVGIEVVVSISVGGKQSRIYIACDDAATARHYATLPTRTVVNNQIAYFVQHNRTANIPARTQQRIYITLIRFCCLP